MALPQLPKLEMTVQFRSPAPTHFSKPLAAVSFHTILSLPRRGLAAVVNPVSSSKATSRGNFDESTASSARSQRSDIKKSQQGERRWYSVCHCQILLHVGNRLEVARISISAVWLELRQPRISAEFRTLSAMSSRSRTVKIGLQVN